MLVELITVTAPNCFTNWTVVYLEDFYTTTLRSNCFHFIFVWSVSFSDVQNQKEKKRSFQFSRTSIREKKNDDLTLFGIFSLNLECLNEH